MVDEFFLAAQQTCCSVFCFVFRRCSRTIVTAIFRNSHISYITMFFLTYVLILRNSPMLSNLYLHMCTLHVHGL